MSSIPPDPWSPSMPSTPWMRPRSLPQISPPINVPPENIPASPLPHPFFVIPVNPALARISVDMSNELPEVPFHDQAASLQSVKLLKLRSYLPWEIEVRTSTHQYVTVRDILQTLHRALRWNMTLLEILEMNISRNIPPQVLKQYSESMHCVGIRLLVLVLLSSTMGESQCCKCTSIDWTLIHGCSRSKFRDMVRSWIFYVATHTHVQFP